MSQPQSTKPSPSWEAFKKEFSEARTPYRRVAAIKRFATRKRFEALIPIRTIEEALDWGDSWERAYRELLTAARKETSAMQDRILLLETELLIEQCERQLERLGAPDGR